MTLQQLDELRRWHRRQGRRHPLEKALWDAVLTAWLLGCVGIPAAFLLDNGWAEAACLPLLFLPGLYVEARRRLHNQRRLRCDWIIALR